MKGRVRRHKPDGSRTLRHECDSDEILKRILGDAELIRKTMSRLPDTEEYEEKRRLVFNQIVAYAMGLTDAVGPEVGAAMFCDTGYAPLLLQAVEDVEKMRRERNSAYSERCKDLLKTADLCREWMRRKAQESTAVIAQ